MSVVVSVMGGSIVKECFSDGGANGGVGLMDVGCGMCGFDRFCFDFFVVVIGASTSSWWWRWGVAMVVVGMGLLWWRWLWFGSDLGLWVFGSNFGGLDQIWWHLGG